MWEIIIRFLIGGFVVSVFALISDMLKPELEGFFVDYHRLSGEQFRAIGVKGPNNARKRIKDN